MECRDVRELADSFLAEELLTETNHEILRHVQACPTCADDLASRRALRDAVRRAISNAPGLAPRPEFVSELQARLRTETARASTRRRVRLAGWWAVAATALLAVAVGLVYRTGDRIGALAQSAVGDHRNCALQFRLEEKPISLEEAARRYGAWYRALEREPAAELITDAGPARVLERHACIYRGRRFAHVVLRYRNERVSLLVAAAPGAGRAADAVGQLPPITSGAVVDGMSVVSFASPNHVVFVVGNVPAQELAALARALAETIPRQLSSV